MNMDNFYVEINEDNIVIGVFMTTAEIIDQPNIIPIEIYDESLLDKKYENGEFIDVEIEE